MFDYVVSYRGSPIEAGYDPHLDRFFACVERVGVTFHHDYLEEALEHAREAIDMFIETGRGPR